MLVWVQTGARAQLHHRRFLALVHISVKNAITASTLTEILLFYSPIERQAGATEARQTRRTHTSAE